MKLSNVPRWINNIKTTNPGSNSRGFSSADVAALCIWLEMRNYKLKQQTAYWKRVSFQTEPMLLECINNHKMHIIRESNERLD